MSITETMYKDVRAIALEDEALRAVFLPDDGAKLASLIHKRSGREFLVQAEGDQYRKLDYYGDYINTECSGFDDMFPTIDAAYYPAPPWSGILMPDHGEVCRLKWSSDIQGGCLHMAVHGVRFPYRLEKWAEMDDDGALRIRYRATNLSAFDMDFLWAAHAMLNAEEGGKFLVPYENGQKSVCMFSTGDRLGKYGELLNWPVHESGGIRKDLSTTSLNGEPGSYKHYFNAPIPKGWCAYRYPSDSIELRLEFPQEQVPYLGVWVNEGGFKGYFNIAPELCTGAFDRPDIAKQRDMNSVLKAGTEYEWSIAFRVRQFSSQCSNHS